jgi:hypothetical protein
MSEAEAVKVAEVAAGVVAELVRRGIDAKAESGRRDRAIFILIDGGRFLLGLCRFGRLPIFGKSKVDDRPWCIKTQDPVKVYRDRQSKGFDYAAMADELLARLEARRLYATEEAAQEAREARAQSVAGALGVSWVHSFDRGDITLALRERNAKEPLVLTMSTPVTEEQAGAMVAAARACGLLPPREG